MLSLANFVSTAREVAFRAPHWHTASPAQLDGDGDAVPPLHIPQSDFPRSLYATDGTMVHPRSAPGAPTIQDC